MLIKYFVVKYCIKYNFLVFTAVCRHIKLIHCVIQPHNVLLHSEEAHLHSLEGIGSPPATRALVRYVSDVSDKAYLSVGVTVYPKSVGWG